MEQKDEIIQKKLAIIQEQKEEIERRQFVEKKVQTYVKSLCDQNEKCKDFLKNNLPDQSKVDKFLLSLQLPSGKQESEESEEEESDDA